MSEYCKGCKERQDEINDLKAECANHVDWQSAMVLERDDFKRKLVITRDALSREMFRRGGLNCDDIRDAIKQSEAE